MGNDTVRNRQEAPAEDPLAELARLMGQEDEFADLLRESERTRRPAPAPQAAAPRPQPPQPAVPRPAAPRAPEAGRPAAGSFAALAAEVYSEGAQRPAPPRPSSEAAARDANLNFGRIESPSPRPAASIENRPTEPRPAESRPAEARAPYMPPRPQPTEAPRRAAPVAPPIAPSSHGDAPARPPLNPAASARPAPPRSEAPQPAARPQPAQDPDFDFGLDSRLPSWMARGGAAAPTDEAPARPKAPTPASTIAPTPAPGHAPPATRAAAPVPGRQFDLDEDAYDYGRSAVEDRGDVQSYEVDELDAEPPVRNGRRRLMVVGGAMAVCVVAAGAYAVFSGSGGGTSGPAGDPPVIRADQGPNKVTPNQPAPEQSASGDGQKLIYDRVGGSPTTGNEKVVSSEEQPVDVSQAAQPQPPRVISTTPSAGSNAANSGEPKRVRTLTVRADGTVVPDDSGPAPTPMTPAAMPASAQSTASAPIPLNTGNGAPVSTDPTPLSATPSIVDNLPAPAPSRVAAAPAPAAAPASTASVPAPAGAYVVQVASVRSEAEAQSTWRSMQGKYPGVLASQPFSIKRADLGDRGVYYRAQVGSFSGREDAVRLCEALRAAGGDCMVQRN